MRKGNFFSLKKYAARCKISSISMKNYWEARVLFSRSNFCSHVKNVSQSIEAEIRFFFVELSYSETLFPKILENAALNSMRRPWKPSFKAIFRS